MKFLYDILPQLSTFGFYCIDDFLAHPLTKTHLKLLNKFELKQIKHWQPKTIGEVVFNHWD